MMFRFPMAAICLSFIAAMPATAGKKTARHRVVDAMTTAAIDIAANAIQTRLSRVPNDGQIEIAFAPLPQRSAERLVIKVIDAGETSVFIAAYQMTSKPIADALCRANARGLAVSAVLDAKSNPHNKGSSKRDYLVACGVDVKADARYPIMHDKFIVVDGKHVETGSFNYSFAAAERNAENAIVVWNNVAMAQKYNMEFDRLFDEAAD